MTIRKLTVPTNKLRWHLDPATLPFATTDDLAPQQEIVGQKRAVEAFRFGMGINKRGYNIFVTGMPGTGRMATVKKLLSDLTRKTERPCDLCYVNNFKEPESPALLRLPAGRGAAFKKGMRDFLDNMKREVPLLFESDEYLRRKNAIMEEHERKVREFYKSVEDKVKDTDLVVVNIQVGQVQRPDVVPLVDGEPKRIVDLEEMVEKGDFPRKKFNKLAKRRLEVKEELEHIVMEVKKLSKLVKKNSRDVDREMFAALATEYMQPLLQAFNGNTTKPYLDSVLEHMLDNLDTIKLLGAKPQAAGGTLLAPPPPEVIFQPYEINLIVDNSEQKGGPVIIESYPTYRNLFGSIERVMDRNGGWRTDFTKIKAGSFIKANGGYLVINLLDAIVEPGVWQTLKRSLKTEKIEIQTFDPHYFMTATGLQPEPIEMDVKVVVLGDPRLYQLLRRYDPDVPQIFKVRADYETTMDKTEDNVLQVARLIKKVVDKEELLPFEASGVARIIERTARMAGRQEKISTSFPIVSDLLIESDHFARVSGDTTVTRSHVEQALDAKIYRSNQIEERVQEMIDRGSLFVDTDGAVVGQVNGLAVYSMGDYAFGKPSRITAVTSVGKEGFINIEREADLSGPTHNKGMLILQGFLRDRFARKTPMALAASIAFEQSYGGVDGDSASSTELYALLSSLAEIPIRQDIAVTGSVNQKGEVQPIGGVNEKVEGFYHCCRSMGLTGKQGVMIPAANVKDLMLKQEVADAITAGDFHLWAVRSIEEGIELLTGTKAGRRGKNGRFPARSIFGKAETKLAALAKSLKEFGREKAGKKSRS